MIAAHNIVIEQLRQLSDTDNQQLDAYVKAHHAGSPYHLSAWRKAALQAYQHQELVLLARQQSNIVGFLPLCQMHLPLLGKKLISLPFADYCGVLADNADITAELLSAASALLTTSAAKSLELRGRATDTWSATLLPDDLNAINAAKVRMVVSLPADADTLLASYKPKLRSQIKKAQKNGLTAEFRSDAAALHLFYPIYSKNMHRLGSPVHSFQWFTALHSQQQLHIALVYFEQEVVAAGIVLINNKQACIPWASTLVEFNHLAPNMLLYWHIQAELTQLGIGHFDMGRSTQGEGTYRFKAQWGAEPENLYWFADHGQGLKMISTTSEQSPPSSSGNSALRKWVAWCWCKLPLAVATRLGAYLRRYIPL